MSGIVAGALVLSLSGGSTPAQAARIKSKASKRLVEDRPLYEGLPERLPGDYLSQKGFLPFEGDPDHGFAPLVSMLLINGERKRGGIFTEKLWVRIPEGARITSRMSSGVDVWNYPVGTESMHEIRFDTDASEPFELRTVRLLADGRWAFGSYRSEGGAWVLYTAVPPVQESLELKLRGTDAPSKLEFKRINIRSCQACHHMNAVKEQFSTRERTGPCAFVSWNSTILEGWARLFEKKMGYFPIVRE
jgi:hypothetical protein